MELVSSLDRFYIDARFVHYNEETPAKITKIEDVLYTCDLENLTGGEEESKSQFITFMQDVTDTPWAQTVNSKTANTYFKRSLIQKSISKFSNFLFRSISLKSSVAEIKTSALIQYLDLTKLDI